MREMVAFVLHLLDLFRLVPDSRVAGQHLFEQAAADAELGRQGHELAVEVFVARDESESKRHSVSLSMRALGSYQT